jgi:hypothetical protein
MAPSVSSHYNFQLLPLACVWHKNVEDKKNLSCSVIKDAWPWADLMLIFSNCSLFEAGTVEKICIILLYNIIFMINSCKLNVFSSKIYIVINFSKER